MAHGKAWMVSKKVCDPPCDPCQSAYAEHLRKVRIKKGLRKWDVRLDAAKSRQRLLELRDKYNFSSVEMARRTGMAQHSIGRIMNGTTNMIYTSSARKIFKMYNEVVTRHEVKYGAHGDMVPAGRARVALRGLAAQGYSREWIRQKIDTDINTIWRITMDTNLPKSRKFIRAETETKILALVREVGSSDGGNRFAQSKALKRGWKPTMWYDELV